METIKSHEGADLSPRVDGGVELVPEGGEEAHLPVCQEAVPLDKVSKGVL